MNTNNTNTVATLQDIANGFIDGQAAVKRAKQVVFSARYLGTTQNMSVAVAEIPKYVNGDLFAAAEIASIVRKEAKRGMLVVTSNLDDGTFKLQVSQQSLVVEGLNFGASFENAKALPQAKVEEPEQVEAA